MNKSGEITSSLNVESSSFPQPTSLMYTQYKEIETSVGLIIPQYHVEDHGRQQHKPAYFYKNGNIKKVALQNKITWLADSLNQPLHLV